MKNSATKLLVNAEVRKESDLAKTLYEKNITVYYRKHDNSTPVKAYC